MSQIKHPTVLLLFSAFLWACFPLLISIAAISGFNASLEFSALLNIIGFLMCLIILVCFLNSSRINPLFYNNKNGRFLVLIDGAAIALSNAVAFWAISIGNSIAVAFILESWPIFVFLALAFFLKRYQNFSAKNGFIAIIGLIGFYFMQFTEGEWISYENITPIILAIIAAFLQVVTVVVNQQNLSRLNRNVKFDDVLQLQVVRMLVATITCLFIIFLLYAFDIRTPNFTVISTHEFLAGAILAGVFVTGSALLYALGLANAYTPVVNLVWFLTPAITAVLLYVFGFGELNRNIIIGSIYVLSALMLVKQREESPAPFIAIVLSVLFFGTLVTYAKTESYQSYFEYIQLTGIIYGILQAFILSRLWQRRLDLYAYEHLISKSGSFFFRKNATSMDNSIIEDAKIRSFTIRREAKTYSELLILTFLGIANIFILIAGREFSFLGNSVCFLLSIAIIYLLVMSWSLNLEISTSKHKKVTITPENLADATLSYAFLAVSIFTFLFLFFVDSKVVI